MFKETSNMPDGTTQYFRQLEGIAEVIELAKIIDNSERLFRRGCGSTAEDRNDFTHTKTLTEAIDLCQNGWPEGRQKIKDALADLDEDGVANLGSQVNYDFDVSGDEPDVDRYLAGEPESMIDYFIKPNSKGRNVKLIVSAAQPAFIHADKITRRGVAIAAALESVALAGFGIELEMAERTTSSEYTGTAAEYRIPVVKAGDYLNLDSLAFALLHPSFLRRMIFALNENETERIRNLMGFWVDRGYGRPAEPQLRPDEDTAVIVDRDEGMLDSDSQIPAYAVTLAKQLIRTTEGDNND